MNEKSLKIQQMFFKRSHIIKKTISAWGKISKMKTIENNKVQSKQGGHL